MARGKGQTVDGERGRTSSGTSSRGVKNVDARLVGKFIDSPSVRWEKGSARTGELRSYVDRERYKTDWVAGGNVYLPDTGDFISKSDYEKLPSELQAKLREMGVEDYNEWIGRVIGPDEKAVLDAVSEGYVVYDDIAAATGLRTVEVRKAVDILVRTGYLTKPGST